MHILQIIPSLPYAGAELLLFRICRELGKKEPSWRLHVLTVFEPGPLAPAFEKIGIPVDCLYIRHEQSQMIKLRLMQRFIRMNTPDCVHTHLYDGDRYGQVAAWLCSIPKRFMTIHSIENNRGFKRYIWDIITSRLCTRIVTVSNTARYIWGKERGLPYHKMRTIYNAPDISNRKIIPPRLHPGNFPFKWICVGRLHPEKGQIFLVDAFSQLILSHPDTTLDIYGATDSDYAKRVQNRISENGLSGNIRLMGVTPNILECYQKYDAYISTSLIEGFGIANVEAMTFGLPVLASDIPVNREIFNIHESAMFFSPGDAMAISHAMRNVMENPALYNSLSLLNLKRTNDFSLDDTVGQYRRLYQGEL